MTLTQSEIRSLKPTSNLYKKGLGEGLFVYVDRQYIGKGGEKRGGGKYFKGRFKGKEIQIGVVGTASGEYSLTTARKKWDQIRSGASKINAMFLHIKISSKQREQLRKHLKML